MHHPDICIAGAGIIGLSLAIELQHRGFRVTVLDQAAPLAEASTAAAGMLAAGDPANPAELRALAELSLSLYPDFLDRLHVLSGIRVPFQTHTTLQAVTPGGPGTGPELTPKELANLLPALVPADQRFILLDEHSLDPRQLAPALLAAVRAASIDLRPNTPVLSTRTIDNAIEIHTPTGSSPRCKICRLHRRLGLRHISSAQHPGRPEKRPNALRLPATLTSAKARRPNTEHLYCSPHLRS